MTLLFQSTSFTDITSTPYVDASVINTNFFSKSGYNIINDINIFLLELLKDLVCPPPPHLKISSFLKGQ
ncbi:hypothetical protein AYI68_g4327 [Smittium mucronatum]|uniref:Uncharacterized protein n=1 Tax=Smittium mucronatum TaxID=133383 RepID=A0A1R0GXE4_9FUNG|nr:hypothetical protein AYI68_g4327 [Smittium mucronatum]